MDLHLAFGDQVPRQFEMMPGAVGFLFKELGGGVQLQGDARERLFQGVVQFLGQPCSLGQGGFGLKLQLLARRDLKFQLRRPFLDSFLQLIARLPQRQPGLSHLADGDLQGRVLFGHHDRPTHRHDGHGQQDAQAGQKPPRGQPTGARQDADALARWHQDLKRSGFAVLAAFGEAHPADFNRAAQGQGRQVPHGAGGFRLGVESDVLILQHQDCPD